MAQSVLSDWVGKFLFAHVLQGHREEAHAVSAIGADHTPEDALKVFQELSEKCNFFTIFGSTLASERLSDQAWLDLRQLNGLLSNLRLGGIEQLQLSHLLEGSVEVSRRKIKGQYPTPDTLARLLVSLCINDIENSRVLDPLTLQIATFALARPELMTHPIRSLKNIFTCWTQVS